MSERKLGVDSELSDIFERLDALSDLVEENNKISHDTNRILRQVRRTGRISFWFKVIIWTIVIIVPFFFIGPIMTFFSSITGLPVPNGSTSILGIPSQAQIQGAISQYQNKVKTK